MVNIGKNWGIAWDGTEAPAYSDYSRQAAASTCLAIISAQQRCQFCETQEPNGLQSNTQCSIGEGDLHNIVFTE